MLVASGRNLQDLSGLNHLNQHLKCHGGLVSKEFLYLFISFFNNIFIQLIGMILAGGKGTKISASINEINFQRIPSPIAKQLIKLKPRIPGICNQLDGLSLTTAPDGYYLVEFFGTHDFGWIKADSTLLFNSDGVLPVAVSIKYQLFTLISVFINISTSYSFPDILNISNLNRVIKVVVKMQFWKLLKLKKCLKNYLIILILMKNLM